MRTQHIIVRLVTGAVLFGGNESVGSEGIKISKPYTYVALEDGNVSMAPYDTYALQGELNMVFIPIHNVLYYGDLADCSEARDAYISATSGIVLPNNKIII